MARPAFSEETSNQNYCLLIINDLELNPLVDQPASPVTSKSSHRGAELPGRKPPIALAMNDFRPLVQHHADVDLM